MTFTQKLIHIKGSALPPAAGPRRAVPTKPAQTSGGKWFDVAITHPDFHDYHTQRELSDGDNGTVTDSLERIITTGYGSISETVVSAGGPVPNALVTYRMQEDTARKWIKTTDANGTCAFDSLPVNLPQSPYRVTIEPTPNALQFTVKEMTRAIYAGDNGAVTDSVEEIRTTGYGKIKNYIHLENSRVSNALIT